MSPILGNAMTSQTGGTVFPRDYPDLIAAAPYFDCSPYYTIQPDGQTWTLCYNFPQPVHSLMKLKQ